MISVVAVTAENFSQFQELILETETASFPSPWSLNAFRQELDRPVSRLWVLLVDNEFAGYICFWVLADEIHLMNFAIHAAKQNQGLGTYLLNRMIQAGAGKNIRQIWLEVRPSNLAARFLYRKIGFREIGRRRHYYTDTNEDAIVMSLPLDAAASSTDPPEENKRLKHVM